MKIRRIKIRKDSFLLSLAGLIIISQLCIGLDGTHTNSLFKIDKSGYCPAIVSPRKYFISEITHLFSDWGKDKNIQIEEEMNKVFKDLNIKARLIKNTLKFDNDSYEFLVYIEKYKRSFPVKYTPLVEDINQIIEKEKFDLEIKVFSAWRPFPLDQLFV